MNDHELAEHYQHLALEIDAKIEALKRRRTASIAKEADLRRAEGEKANRANAEAQAAEQSARKAQDAQDVQNDRQKERRLSTEAKELAERAIAQATTVPHRPSDRHSRRSTTPSVGSHPHSESTDSTITERKACQCDVAIFGVLIASTVTIWILGLLIIVGVLPIFTLNDQKIFLNRAECREGATCTQSTSTYPYSAGSSHVQTGKSWVYATFAALTVLMELSIRALANRLRVHKSWSGTVDKFSYTASGWFRTDTASLAFVSWFTVILLVFSLILTQAAAEQLGTADSSTGKIQNGAVVSAAWVAVFIVVLIAIAWSAVSLPWKAWSEKETGSPRNARTVKSCGSIIAACTRLKEADTTRPRRSSRRSIVAWITAWMLFFVSLFCYIFIMIDPWHTLAIVDARSHNVDFYISWASICGGPTNPRSCFAIPSIISFNGNSKIDQQELVDQAGIASSYAQKIADAVTSPRFVIYRRWIICMSCVTGLGLIFLVVTAAARDRIGMASKTFHDKEAETPYTLDRYQWMQHLMADRRLSGRAVIAYAGLMICLSLGTIGATILARNELKKILSGNEAGGFATVMNNDAMDGVEYRWGPSFVALTAVICILTIFAALAALYWGWTRLREVEGSVERVARREDRRRLVKPFYQDVPWLWRTHGPSGYAAVKDTETYLTTNKCVKSTKHADERLVSLDTKPAEIEQADKALHDYNDPSSMSKFDGITSLRGDEQQLQDPVLAQEPSYRRDDSEIMRLQQESSTLKAMADLLEHNLDQHTNSMAHMEKTMSTTVVQAPHFDETSHIAALNGSFDPDATQPLTEEARLLVKRWHDDISDIAKLYGVTVQQVEEFVKAVTDPSARAQLRTKFPPFNECLNIAEDLQKLLSDLAVDGAYDPTNPTGVYAFFQANRVSPYSKLRERRNRLLKKLGVDASGKNIGLDLPLAKQTISSLAPRIIYKCYTPECSLSTGAANIKGAMPDDFQWWINNDETAVHLQRLIKECVTNTSRHVPIATSIDLDEVLSIFDSDDRIALLCGTANLDFELISLYKVFHKSMPEGLEFEAPNALKADLADLRYLQARLHFLNEWRKNANVRDHEENNPQAKIKHRHSESLFASEAIAKFRGIIENTAQAMLRLEQRLSLKQIDSMEEPAAESEVQKLCKVFNTMADLGRYLAATLMMARTDVFGASKGDSPTGTDYDKKVVLQDYTRHLVFVRNLVSDWHERLTMQKLPQPGILSASHKAIQLEHQNMLQVIINAFTDSLEAEKEEVAGLGKHPELKSDRAIQMIANYAKLVEQTHGKPNELVESHSPTEDDEVEGSDKHLSKDPHTFGPDDILVGEPSEQLDEIIAGDSPVRGTIARMIPTDAGNRLMEVERFEESLKQAKLGENLTTALRSLTERAANLTNEYRQLEAKVENGRMWTCFKSWNGTRDLETESGKEYCHELARKFKTIPEQERRDFSAYVYARLFLCDRLEREALYWPSASSSSGTSLSTSTSASSRQQCLSYVIKRLVRGRGPLLAFLQSGFFHDDTHLDKPGSKDEMAIWLARTTSHAANLAMDLFDSFTLSKDVPPDPSDLNDWEGVLKHWQNPCEDAVLMERDKFKPLLQAAWLASGEDVRLRPCMELFGGRFDLRKHLLDAYQSFWTEKLSAYDRVPLPNKSNTNHKIRKARMQEYSTIVQDEEKCAREGSFFPCIVQLLQELSDEMFIGVTDAYEKLRGNGLGLNRQISRIYQSENEESAESSKMAWADAEMDPKAFTAKEYRIPIQRLFDAMYFADAELCIERERRYFQLQRFLSESGNWPGHEVCERVAMRVEYVMRARRALHNIQSWRYLMANCLPTQRRQAMAYVSADDKTLRDLKHLELDHFEKQFNIRERPDEIRRYLLVLIKRFRAGRDRGSFLDPRVKDHRFLPRRDYENLIGPVRVKNVSHLPGREDGPWPRRPTTTASLEDYSEDTLEEHIRDIEKLRDSLEDDEQRHHNKSSSRTYDDQSDDRSYDSSSYFTQSDSEAHSPQERPEIIVTEYYGPDPNRR